MTHESENADSDCAPESAEAGWSQPQGGSRMRHLDSPEALWDLVSARLAESGLAPDVADLVSVALRDIQDVQPTSERDVYLKSVTVEGFRGIGPATTLDLPLGPGLTVVKGRNGSGKSSLAEGIELALTGRNRRWEDEDGKTTQQLQQEGWRNLHHDGQSRLDLQLLASGRTEPITLSRVWTGAGYAECTAQVTGLGPEPLPWSTLGWQESLRAFRPILSYSELGQLMTAKPAQIYDRLAALLGLGPVYEAVQLLNDRDKQLGESEKQAKVLRPELMDRLALSTDDRAQAAREALASRIPDRERVRALIAGTQPADAAELARLSRESVLEGPDPGQVAKAVTRLREARAVADDHRLSEAGDALERAELLDRALRLRRAHPQDHTCPVCQSPDRLDEEWAAAGVAHVDLLREQAREADQARHALRSAADDLRAMVLRRPVGLPAGMGPLWDDWEACRGLRDPDELAAAAEKRAFVLAEACRQIRGEALARLAELDDEWQALVPALVSWLTAADGAVAAGPERARLKKAHTWLKGCYAVLRDEQMRAIASTAQDIWSYLCQESDVKLGDVVLTGTDGFSRRGVELNVNVDGVDASALGVVSQGELFSLALALYLPRATARHSPFRFLVIDDPVQSMDPRKVEGLARLLHALAQTHQVIVFSHDTRLHDALNFHRISATVIDVGRAKESVVTLDKADDPVARELEYAQAVVDDRRITPELLADILPGQCRVALEAALGELARRTLYAAPGSTFTGVDRSIDAARELIDLASLALFGERRNKAEVYREIERRLDRNAAEVVRQCNRGSHQSLTGIGDGRAFLRRVACVTEGIRNL